MPLVRVSVTGNRADYCAGIQNCGRLTLDACIVSANEADVGGGGIGSGGLLNCYAPGARAFSLIIRHSEISENTAYRYDAGISHHASHFGHESTATIEDSVITNNAAGPWGSTASAGGISNAFYAVEVDDGLSDYFALRPLPASALGLTSLNGEEVLV